MKDYDVKNLEMANEGREKISWAEEHMPVLMKIRKRFKEEKPLNGLVI